MAVKVVQILHYNDCAAAMENEQCDKIIGTSMPGRNATSW
jgi:hypothetical protein